MNHQRCRITKLAIGLGFVSIVAAPLTLAAGASSLAPQLLSQPFGHTPSIVPLASEEAPDDLLEDELELPDIFVEGNVLVVDGKPYPIETRSPTEKKFPPVQGRPTEPACMATQQSRVCPDMFYSGT